MERPTERHPAAFTLILVAVATVAVGAVRGRLYDVTRQVRETSDVYVLPPPRQVVTMSLGYRAALVDLLWSNVLVSQGLHMGEKRRYGNLTGLLDTINELEPTFRDPYTMADALITFQAGKTPHDEVVKARAIMERGLETRPLDAELWSITGSFVAFIAPGSYLTDPAEKDRWKVEGARMLARAGELGGDAQYVGWQALGAAGLLTRAGEREATIRFLRRTLAVTDDAELKERATMMLAKLVSEQREEERDDVLARLERGIADIRRADLPFVSRRQYMLLNPPRDPAYCAGRAHAGELACAPTWKDWEERSEAARPKAP